MLLRALLGPVSHAWRAFWGFSPGVRIVAAPGVREVTRFCCICAFSYCALETVLCSLLSKIHFSICIHVKGGRASRLHAHLRREPPIKRLYISPDSSLSFILIWLHRPSAKIVSGNRVHLCLPMGIVNLDVLLLPVAYGISK